LPAHLASTAHMCSALTCSPAFPAGNTNTLAGNVPPKADLGDLSGLASGASMIDGKEFNGAKAYKDSKVQQQLAPGAAQCWPTCLLSMPVSACLLSCLGDHSWPWSATCSDPAARCQLELVRRTAGSARLGRAFTPLLLPCRCATC
jgi:hypothetical protein